MGQNIVTTRKARGVALAALAIAVGVPLLFAACLTNDTGHISATLLGDTSHPADRASPVADLRAACGTGASTAAGAVITRQPYLQDVTTSAATFGWVTTAPAGERVVVTTPVGAAVASAVASVDASAQKVEGKDQMWATVTGLAPDTAYCYSVVAGDAGALETPTGFRTAPTADEAAPVRFLAFGDSGSGDSDQTALRGQMSSFPYQIMIHTGDVAYDDGTVGEFDANVFDVYADLFRNVPFFPAAGNHEYDTQDAAPFRSVFALPRPASATGQWYSYDWGRVHFVALDTEADYGTQAAWLDGDLTANALPWTIVYFHRPPYSSGEHGSDTSLRSKLAPVFAKHHVQLVLSGHDHDYERMVPQGGTEYVVTGGGGVGTRSVGKSSFTAFSEAVIHFVYGEVGPDQMVLHAVDATGVEFDSVVIPR